MVSPELTFIIGKIIKMKEDAIVSGSHYFRAGMKGVVVGIEHSYSGIDHTGKPEEVYKLLIDFTEFRETVNSHYEDINMPMLGHIDRDNGKTNGYMRKEHIIDPDKMIYNFVNEDSELTSHNALGEEFILTGEPDYIKWLETKLIEARIARDQFADAIYNS